MTDALLYLPGERVRSTGVYEVLHFGHRAPHEAFLWEGENFPRCQQCGGNVIFRFVRSVEEPTCNHVCADENFTSVFTTH